MSTKATARPCLPTPASRACLTIRHELPGNNQFIFRRRRIISASAENRGNSCQRKHSAPGTRLGQSCVSQTSQLKTRIVSVARIRLNPWKTVRPFKGICDDISEFESYMPSHPVRSPPPNSPRTRKSPQAGTRAAIRCASLWGASLDRFQEAGGQMPCEAPDTVTTSARW
jgi:hypothetical protein